jgi:putative ABC transport system permease protein
MTSNTSLRIALRSLQRSPLRSGLTALGIVMGVASVFATATIGNGAQARVSQLLARPEARAITLSASAPVEAGFAELKLRPGDRLTVDDYYAIRDRIDKISAASPRIYLANIQTRTNRGHRFQAQVEGVDVGGFSTVPRQLLSGNLFGHEDVRRAAPVCVVSESLAKRIVTGNGNLYIRIGGVPHLIIGVVDDVPYYASAELGRADLRVYVPFTSLLRNISPQADITVGLQVADPADVEIVQKQINELMEQRRGARTAEFRTSNYADSVKAYTDTSLTVARLLAAVGGISLIVGGIGISNIMMMSVAERTREIGVRMAIGTRSALIEAQLLIESGTLGVLGGAIGIVIGWAISHIISAVNGWPVQVRASSILFCLACGLAVGLFFGYQPARKAALLPPVEALRI